MQIIPRFDSFDRVVAAAVSAAVSLASAGRDAGSYKRLTFDGIEVTGGLSIL